MSKTRICQFAASLLAGCIATTLWSAATQPATKPAAASKPSTTLRDQFVSEYMKGDWDKLEADIRSNNQQILALPEGQAADVAYIRQALAECHQDFWKFTMSGKQGVIHPKVWGHTIDVTYLPQVPAGTLNISVYNGHASLGVNWGTGDLENTDNAEHGYTKGDLANVGMWGNVEMDFLLISMSPEKFMKFTDVERAAFNVFVGFRGAANGLYYCTPRGRTWDIFLSLDAYQGEHQTAAGFIPRKPIGALIVSEIVGHPKLYPSIRLPARQPTENVEQRLATQLMSQFEKRITFAEDKALRDMAKTFVMANSFNVYNNGLVTFPNKQQMSLDPSKDADLAKKRDAWLLDQLKHPSTSTAPASPKN